MWKTVVHENPLVYVQITVQMKREIFEVNDGRIGHVNEFA